MPKYKKRKDGRFRARVWDGTYTDNGQKHYIDLYSTKSSRDLELKVIEYETQKKQGLVSLNKNVDIYEYSCNWVRTTKAFKEERTQAFYWTITHKIKELQGVTFENLNYNLVQNLINQHSKSPVACSDLKKTLRAICKTAEKDKILPRGVTEDIFDRVEVPKHTPKVRSPLSESDKNALNCPELTLQEKAFLYVLYFTGMRRGEALALTKADITHSDININKSFGIKQSSEFYLKAPKTIHGIRTVPIPNKLREFLDEYLPTLDTDYLFTFEGKPLTYGRVNAMWKEIKRKTNINVTPHYFRHNYCTMLCYQAALERNITTKKIAELLGDTEEMVLKVYSHIMNEKENVTEAVNNALDF